jgi:DNA processing protein
LNQRRDRIGNWLHLHLCDQVGSVTFFRLLKAFGSVDEVLAAGAGKLASVKGIGAKTAEKIAHSRDEVDIDAELELTRKMGIDIITFDCESYPGVLKSIHDPPAVLYVKGTLEASDGLAVALVGSRYCNAYGQEQSARLSHLLAAAGFTIVSGLARGIDTAAHRAALAAKGRTIAVQGCGLGKIFPPENEKLADQISKQGAVISELPIGFEPLSNMFPARNRIISGLSQGVIVVEAQKRSGALITARLAMEQGREVMAVPGRIDSPNSNGCHQLIKDGAQLIEGIEDVMDALGQVGEILRDHAKESAEATQAGHEKTLFDRKVEPQKLKLSETETKVMETLDHEPMHIDQIAQQTGMSVGVVNGCVTVLQLKGIVKQLPGSFFQRR